MESIIIGGVDTYDELGLVLTVDSMLPPEPKFYTVDVPGGNGKLNLTTALFGDTAYNNREQRFIFTMRDPLRNFEEVKTDFLNRFHGKEFDYKLSWDMDYTYHGWFKVDDHTRLGNLMQIAVTIDADPYKFLRTETIAQNVSKGQILTLYSGRKKVQPTFEFSDPTIVIFNGERYEVPAGTYTLNDVWFEHGANEVFLMSVDAPKLVTWDEASSFTWGEVRQRFRAFELYNGIEKYAVTRIEVTGATASGSVTFTATDGNGGTSSLTVNLGSIAISPSDTMVVHNGYMEVRSKDATTGASVGYTLVCDILPHSYDARIDSLTCSAGGVVKYDTATALVIENADVSRTTWADMEAHTWGSLGRLRWSQVYTVFGDATEKVFVEAEEKAAYISYDWSDL